MIQRMLASGLFAGVAAGLIAALLHFAFVQNVLLLAEEYEAGALVHFQGALGGDAAAGHDHADAAATAAADDHDHAEGTAPHDHPDAGEGESHLKRNALTVMFMALTYSAYGLILVAGMALAARFGITVNGTDGILWGIAGFVSFQFAPAMGLAPELPGTVAADLGARQIWWWGTVLSTATGLALLAYGRSFVTALLGGALLAAPHVIGAPELDVYYGVAPPEVAAKFAAGVLGTALVSWSALGWFSARLWNSSAPTT
jgi:cobalt transporter subunit CbtA